MIYTVYKSVGCGMGAVEADLHDIAQAVTNNFTSYRSFTLNPEHFVRC